MTFILTNVKSCHVLLRMLLIRIGSYLKSVLRYKYFSCRFPSSEHPIFTWERLWGSVVVLL